MSVHEAQDPERARQVGRRVAAFVEWTTTKNAPCSSPAGRYPITAPNTVGKPICILCPPPPHVTSRILQHSVMRVRAKSTSPSPASWRNWATRRPAYRLSHRSRMDMRCSDPVFSWNRCRSSPSACGSEGWESSEGHAVVTSGTDCRHQSTHRRRAGRTPLGIALVRAQCELRTRIVQAGGRAQCPPAGRSPWHLLPRRDRIGSVGRNVFYLRCVVVLVPHIGAVDHSLGREVSLRGCACGGPRDGAPANLILPGPSCRKL